MATTTATVLSDRDKKMVLLACILGSSVVLVDSTVVNVALPAIREDLGGGFAGQQWTANAYLVTLASLILVGGSLGDILGERRVFSLGVLGFGLASVLCAVAPTIEVLVLSRALQGVAGALLTPAALAVIVAVYRPEERGQAVGSWTAWGAIGAVLGPLIGGQLVDAASWRWIFAINVPLVAATVYLIARYVPGGRRELAETKVDVAGGLMCAFGLAGLTFGLIRQPEVGFGDPTVFVPLVGGIALLASFLAYEARATHPMLPLKLFRSHNFSVGNLETLAMYAGLSLLFFFLALFLQNAAGYSAVAAGTAGLPITVTIFLLARRFGALADRHGPRLLMGLGPLVAASGLALMATLDADLNYVTDLLPPLVALRRGPVHDRGTAHLHRARRSRRVQRRHRQRGEQRDRPAGGPAGSGDRGPDCGVALWRGGRRVRGRLPPGHGDSGRPGCSGRPRGSDRHPQSPPEGGGQELRGRAAGGCPGRGGVPGRE